MNVIHSRKSTNKLVQPSNLPTPTLPTIPSRENPKIHTNPKSCAQQGNWERGLPLARARDKSQLHTPAFLASDCQTDSGCRPSLCSAQPGQPITDKIELKLAKTSLSGTVIGRRHPTPEQKASEPSFGPSSAVQTVDFGTSNLT